ncbi:MAG: hypothetical protein WAK31_29215 [Chthoniobacterales bacterium]
MTKSLSSDGKLGWRTAPIIRWRTAVQTGRNTPPLQHSITPPARIEDDDEDENDEEARGNS